MKKNAFRRYWAAVIGNVLEHYDVALYGFLVPFLSPLFFPYSDPIYSLLAGYALLPLGLISKPLGAFVFGRIGDRWGSSTSLRITLFGMAVATGLMGCLPTFGQAGWLSPTLLVLGRLFQNFFASGEQTGGVLYLLENTKDSRRGLMSSLFDASGIAGILLASAAATWIGVDCWRWLFWVGSLSGLMGMFVRKEMENSKPRAPLKWDASDLAPILSIAAVSGFSYANYYLLSSFLNGYLPLISNITAREALQLNTILLMLDLILLPLFGILSLRIAKEHLMLAAAVAGTVLALPLFLLLEGSTAWIAGAVRITFTVIGVCLSAPFHAWAMESVPVERRFTVCALGSALGGRLIGSPMPAIGIWLFHTTGIAASPAILLIVTGAFAAVSILYPFHLKGTPPREHAAHLESQPRQ